MSNVACQSCPIEMPVEQFIDLVQDGWNAQHTFQQAEFNNGQVIVCRGRFVLKNMAAVNQVNQEAPSE